MAFENQTIQNTNHSTTEQLSTIRIPNAFGIQAPTVLTICLYLQQVQKELLDAELELFNAQQSGTEAADIQKRVNQLKVEAARLGVLPTSR